MAVLRRLHAPDSGTSPPLDLGTGNPTTPMYFKRSVLWLACAAMHSLACSNSSGPAAAPVGGSSGNSSSSGSGVSGGTGSSAGSSSGANSESPSGVGAGGASSGVGAAASGSGLDASAEASAAAVPEGGSGTPDGSAESTPPAFCTPSDAGDGKYTLTGDAAPPEWQLMPGVTAGKLTPSASFLSPTFGLHFPYIIYTSANYVPSRPAIFLVFGDGISTYLADNGFHAATVLDNLTAAGDVPPTVALFIDPPSDGGDPATVRVATYDPPTEKYPTFLMTEIIPQVITGKYSVSSDPDAWALVGYSASGGQGWNDIWKLPDNFHKFIGNSASYGAANVAMYGNVDWVSIISSSPKRDIRASNTTCLNDLMDQRGSWLTIITNVATALSAKGNPWRLMIGPNGHYPPIDGERDFPDSLRWMFQGCKFPPN
jgi:enterochelin esterase-like enzyme